MIIRALLANDWAEVKRIYEAGIATGNATFETKAPEWEAWDQGHRKDCRLVILEDGGVAGWAALSNVSGRCVYAGVAEVSIYIDPAYQGKGLGSRLMEELVKASETAGIWTLQAGIFPENQASIRLHERNGFRVVGIRERLGQRDGRWRDVALLERRSRLAGT